jgi:hypothetical protein
MPTKTGLLCRAASIPLVLCACFGSFATSSLHAADNALPPLGKLKDHFVGKVAVDKKTGEMTLTYDFRNAKQLEDFTVDEGKAIAAKGMLLVEGASVIKHKVRWKSVRVESFIHVEALRGELIAGSTEGRVTVGGMYSEAVYLLGTHVIVDEAVRKGRVPIIFEMDDRAISIQYAQHNLGEKLKTKDPIQIELGGMIKGCGYSQMKIKGIPDFGWIQEEFGTDDKKN